MRNKEEPTYFYDINPLEEIEKKDRINILKDVLEDIKDAEDIIFPPSIPLKYFEGTDITESEVELEYFEEEEKKEALTSYLMTKTLKELDIFKKAVDELIELSQKKLEEHLNTDNFVITKHKIRENLNLKKELQTQIIEAKNSKNEILEKELIVKLISCKIESIPMPSKKLLETLRIKYKKQKDGHELSLRNDLKEEKFTLKTIKNVSKIKKQENNKEETTQKKQKNTI